MAQIDRNHLISLLERLGSADDADVLAAAREIDRQVRESGQSWGDLLARAPAVRPVRETGDGADIVPYRGTFSDDDMDDPARRPEGAEDDLTLIDRLLADYPLSDEARRELLDFKSDIAEGEFTEMDSKYLRDLYARLSRREGRKA